jgi:di/tripeptidase
LGAALSKVPVPSNTPSSLNIGLVEGGTSINTVAPHASLSIDLRSEDASTLDRLEGRVRAAVKRFEYPPEISAQVDIIDDRPAGGLPREHPLVEASGAVLNFLGMSHVAYGSASTDANVPLANGLAAVCVGVTTGGNPHSTDEYIDTAPVGTGLQQLVLLSLVAAHHSREWAMWDNVG